MSEPIPENTNTSHTGLWVVGGFFLLLSLGLLGVVIWVLLKKKKDPTPAPPNPNPPGPTPPPNPNPPLIFPNVGPSDLQWQISPESALVSDGPFYPRSEETDDEILFSSRTRKNKDRAKC